MKIEIVNTGSELMLGFVLNTHQQWICRQCADQGWPVDRQVAIPDTGESIRQAVREAMGRADLVITTGGLGPTSDDITRDLIAEMLGRKLSEHSETVRRLESFFAARKRPMPPSTRIQAMVPEGAIVLTNQHGTAPGLIMEADSGDGHRSVLVMLPGPPRELRPMFTNQVVPWIRQRFPEAEPFVCRVIKSTGLGESLVEEQIAPPLAGLVSRGLEIGYCARVGEVDVRLVARGREASVVVDEAEAVVRGLLEKHIYGQGDEQLDRAVVELLTRTNQTLCVAESCTGGFIANRITNIPGASAAFLGGMVTYSNAMKELLLGVRPETLRQHGAVSEPVAREMAEGARDRSGADHALAVTGIAGPSGGTEEKPVGTVFVALASKNAPTLVLQRINRFDRETFKFVTSQQALEMLRRRVLG